ncbi:MAG: hypothetical protein E7256_13120 [Lachnospiraceae bacterium]|nr:hypothetical protein [Lachnospiraceae bacterium]
MYPNPNNDNCPKCRTKYIFLPPDPIPPAPRPPRPLPPPPPYGGPSTGNGFPPSPYSPLDRRPPYYPTPIRPPFGPGPVILGSESVRTSSYRSNVKATSYGNQTDAISAASRMGSPRFISEPESPNVFLDR